ncbi:S8 family serine peptidase [Spirulina major]|uniref:S8 family serine peptidase n=1 Tax=Spirulina major TaxID=270636 RepID=UPI0009354265|nr:S8 family serine peptidase [Spirulina major]
MSKSPQSPSTFHAFILEPILTPSAIADSPFDEQPDFDDVNVDDLLDNLEGDRTADSLPFDPADIELIPFASPSDSPYTGGEFTVGEDGTVGIDFLFDGGAFRRGEVGIFSLEGLDPDREDFTQLAAQRALSNSEHGHVVISDATDGARFSGRMREADFNAGNYQGVREFDMKAGDRFGIMLASNHSIEEVANGKIENVRFSMSRPDSDLQFGQVADVTGDGNTFAFEDVTLAESDRDYNDIVFQVRGATAETALMDEVVAEGRDWRTHNMGEALIEYAKAYTDNVDYTAAQFEAAREFQPLVGVIDSGVDADALGMDADAILTGSDFVDEDSNSLLATGEGDNHGTQVAGLITNVNDDAPLWVGRAIGSGHWAESLVEFVDAAVESEQPNAVVNLSFDLTQIDAAGNVTTRTEFTPMEMAALEYARQNDVLVVAASGNQGALMSALGQASERFDNIITVGAAEQVDPDASNWQGYDRATYSSYGQGLDIMANGGTEANPIGGGYGSSMAAAQVTGAISQVWAANPDLSYQQAIALLKQTATDLGAANPDLETGAGLLNVAAAVHLAKTIKAEEYEKELQRISLSWSGQEEFEATERAANPDATSSASGQSVSGSQSSMSWRSFLNIFNNPTSSGFQKFLGNVFELIFGTPPVKSSAPNDFNGDGKSDILWRNDKTGQNSIWLMGGADGHTVLNNDVITTVDNLDWKMEGTGDFNGDGKSDILWRNDKTGQNSIWLMGGADGHTVLNNNEIEGVNHPDWKIMPDSDSLGNYYPNIDDALTTYFSDRADWQGASIEAMWDRVGGASGQYGKYHSHIGSGEWTKPMPDDVLKIYEDLSKTIFVGDPKTVTSGYAYDRGYYNGSTSAHSGIDISNSVTNVRSPINGVVAIAPYKEIYKGKYNGWTMAIDETDSSGQKTGRRWWFVHLKPPGSYWLSQGSTISAGQTILSSGNEQNHLHLAVQNVGGSVSNGYGSYNQAVNSVLTRTMSPLHAFWKAQNGIKESVIWNG